MHTKELLRNNLYCCIHKKDNGAPCDECERAHGVDSQGVRGGFMIMFSTHNSTHYFLRKRLIRILPLYYLMTFGTFLILMLFPDMFEQSTADPVFLLKSLLFIPFDIGDGMVQPLMRVGWPTKKKT